MNTTKKVGKRKVVGRLLIIFAVMIALSTIITFSVIPPLIMSDMVNSHIDVEVISSDIYGIKEKQLELRTDDDLTIVSWEVTTESPKAIVILLSGIHNPSVTAFWGYAGMLRENGYASLLIEMRAHGDSEGDRVALGMEEYLDVKAGVDYIKRNPDYKDIPVVVWGTSMGGATAINAMGQIPELDGLISCSAYSSWPDVFFDNMLNMGIPKIVTVVQKPFVKLYLGFKYGFGKLQINPLRQIEKLDGRPAFIAHSKGDSQIPYASFNRIMDKVKGENVQTFVREGDEHFICYDEYFENPIEDKDFSSSILYFLNENFE